MRRPVDATVPFVIQEERIKMSRGAMLAFGGSDRVFTLDGTVELKIHKNGCTRASAV